MTQKEFQLSLKRFISGLVTVPNGQPIRTTTLLFSNGLMDSLRVLDLISFAEATLGIHIPDHRVTLENFRSIRAITRAFCKGRRE